MDQLNLVKKLDFLVRVLDFFTRYSPCILILITPLTATKKATKTWIQHNRFLTDMFAFAFVRLLLSLIVFMCEASLSSRVMTANKS